MPFNKKLNLIEKVYQLEEWKKENSVNNYHTDTQLICEKVLNDPKYKEAGY